MRNLRNLRKMVVRGPWPLITITGSIYTVDLVDIASAAYTAEQQHSSVETPNTPSSGRRILIFGIDSVEI